MLDKSLIENLKRVDPDRARAAMFADKSVRSDLLTLYAFHAELAKVPELVSEEMIGAIRYQWWRDALEEIYSGQTVRKHEVVTSLSELISRTEMPRFWLDGLIDGRERDLDPTPFKSISDAQSYCRKTSGLLMKTAAFCTSPNHDLSALELLGEAWGLTGLARSFRFYSHSMLSEIDFVSLIQTTERSFKEARQALGKFDAKLMPAVAYAALIPKFLKKMAPTDFDPETDVASYSALSKQLRLMGAVIRGRI
ncbi:MAG: squalene/phytoene synthase family protein [Hellea sp.]|nr:squalene/phytoene synthase family protein [Hellea sp.]